jgi:hypothetical protein
MNMNLSRRMRAPMCAMLARTMVLLTMPAPAQTGAALPPNVGTGDCDRACLEGLAEQFIAALVAHDPSKVPLAKGVRYSENSVPLPIPDGCVFVMKGLFPRDIALARQCSRAISRLRIQTSQRPHLERFTISISSDED